MPTVLTKESDGTTILRETRTDEELGREEAILTAANMKIDDLRAYEMRLRDMKATRVKPLSASMNKQALRRARFEAQKEHEARIKQQEKEQVNMIRNLLAAGKQPSEIRRLFASLEEVDKNAAMWKYIDAHVRND